MACILLNEMKSPQGPPQVECAGSLDNNERSFVYVAHLTIQGCSLIKDKIAVVWLPDKGHAGAIGQVNRSLGGPASCYFPTVLANHKQHDLQGLSMGRHAGRDQCFWLDPAGRGGHRGGCYADRVKREAFHRLGTSWSWERSSGMRMSTSGPTFLDGTTHEYVAMWAHVATAVQSNNRTRSRCFETPNDDRRGGLAPVMLILLASRICAGRLLVHVDSQQGL